MREILFRGKCIDNGEWVYGCLDLDPDLERASICGFDYYTDPEDGPQRAEFCVPVIPETVGQYIGLTDKNGKKVFEGDIMAYVSYDGTERVDGVVEYGKFNCSCCDGVYGWHVTDNGDIRELGGRDWYHVCGNIHDNPEKVKEARA